MIENLLSSVTEFRQEERNRALDNY